MIPNVIFFLVFLSEAFKIIPAKLRSYFSVYRGVKSANNALFKDFYNEEKLEKNE